MADLCRTFHPLCFCESPGSCRGLLFDGNTTSVNNCSIDLQTFWAFNGSSDGNINIIVLSNQPVKEIVLHFYNSPTELIGLPDIEITNTADANSVPFFFTDNDDLGQTDSQVRSVTLSLSPGVSEFNVRFLFPNNIKIQYMLISEIGLTNAGNFY